MANAGVVAVAAVPETVKGPSVVLPGVIVKVTDPVGPTPPLCVAIVAVNVTLVVVLGVYVFAVTTVAV